MNNCAISCCPQKPLAVPRRIELAFGLDLELWLCPSHEQDVLMVIDSVLVYVTTKELAEA